MTVRRARILAVALVPTVVDVGLLLYLRHALGWILVVADLVAIAVASVLSYLLHRYLTFGANPFARWVRYPWAFAAIASVAAVLDAAVLRLLFTAAGFTSIGGLFVAKLCSLAAAGLVRAAGYRYVLAGTVEETKQRRLSRPESSGTVRFTVVLPAFREPERIGRTVEAVRSELADVAADGGLEIVVVDDGSGDGTADAAFDAGADQVITLPRNRGKGGAVRAGMLASRGRTVAFTDADLEYDPPHLRQVLAAIEDGWDVAIGSRQHPDSVVAGTPGLRVLGSRVVNLLATAALLAAPRDTQCGLKGFRGDVARIVFAHTEVDRFAFDIEVLHLVEHYELSLVELPVRLGAPEGGSTVRIVADVLRLVRDLFWVRRRSLGGRYALDDDERAVLGRRGTVGDRLTGSG